MCFGIDNIFKDNKDMDNTNYKERYSIVSLLSVCFVRLLQNTCMLKIYFRQGHVGLLQLEHCTKTAFN